MKSILFRKNEKTKGTVYSNMSSLYPKFGRQIFPRQAGDIYFVVNSDDIPSTVTTRRR